MRVLLYGSLAFYIYHEIFFAPILIDIGILSFVTGHLIYKYKNYKKSILLLFFLILFSLYFPLKYNETFEKLMSSVFHFEGLRWLYLPLGLSFYAYKTMSYVFDIYYEKSVPQKSLEKYLLFVSFFPQIFCGPIMSPDEFFTQLKFRKNLNFDEVLDGLRLVVIGVFKKLVLANNLILIIQNAFYNPTSVGAIGWIVISIITRFYIYYDFSGYSDISNGVSLLFGIKVQKNFDLPFKSKSITEFWRRWHISLSSWIRDYVYFPLVSKFSSYIGIYISLILSFVILGLWHGDKLNYILYGLVNGLAIAYETYKNKKHNVNERSTNIYKVLISKISLYLFLIFLPSLLLMVRQEETILIIIKSFFNPNMFFDFKYFSFQRLIPIVYMVIPLAVVFESILMIYGKKLKDAFELRPSYQRNLILLLATFTIFALLSPDVNYRFLYQGF